jgi:phage terminase small subunit
MAKKPPLPPPDPPGHLSDRSQELWRAVITGPLAPGRAAVVITALEALDRAGEASRILAAEGLTVTTATTGVAHVHPAVKIERDSRALFARLWMALGLDQEQTRSG